MRDISPEGERTKKLLRDMSPIRGGGVLPVIRIIHMKEIDFFLLLLFLSSKRTEGKGSEIRGHVP